jgi:hypothetical protein
MRKYLWMPKDLAIAKLSKWCERNCHTPWPDLNKAIIRFMADLDAMREVNICSLSDEKAS